MLSGINFYHRTIRRNVVAFGNMFRDIVVIKYDNSTNPPTEISRMTVPLQYGGKEDFYTRLQALPDLPAANEITLPRMSFSLESIVYDKSRQKQSQLQNMVVPTSGTPGSVSVQYIGVPYNLGFELSVYVRNIEDGTQIIEQILPYFNPDYNLTMNFVDEMNISRNVPIALQDIRYENLYEGDAKSTIRSVIWTLTFSMQTYFFGPVYSGGLIKQATANMFYYATSTSDQSLTLTTTNTPFGNYQYGEVVYQGTSLPNANALGRVLAWNPAGGQLVLNNIQGTFVANANIIGSLNAGSVEVLNVPANNQFVDITVTPIPANANGLSDFGFSTQITEYNGNG